MNEIISDAFAIQKYSIKGFTLVLHKNHMKKNNNRNNFSIRDTHSKLEF